MACGYWARRQDVVIGPAQLPGLLSVPDQPHGLVIFANGSGGSRRSHRTLHIAAELHGRHFATLVFDLLTWREARNRANACDSELLMSRVLKAVDWALSDPRTRKLPIGLLGANTGAAAALAAAAERPDDVCAVVSQGGRPDLTGPELGHVRAPTLLIVGGANSQFLKLNDSAFHHLTCLKHIKIIPGTTHLFAEKRALEAVVNEAAHWFELYLVPASAVAQSAAGRR